MDNKKSYYAIIPATVRYDAKVISGAKLLYGEITALCNEKGFCWATNKYFADLYAVDARTIRRWVEALRNQGYIRVEIVNEVDRKIYVIEGGHFSPGGRTKKSGGVGQKSPHNNTYNNTKNTIAPAKAVAPEKPWNLEEKLQEMESKEGSHLDIIATFIREKSVKVENAKELSAVITRHAKTASLLAKTYSPEKIFNAIDKIKKENRRRSDRGDEVDWTLETILKTLTK